MWQQHILELYFGLRSELVSKVAHDGSQNCQSPITLGAMSLLTIFIFKKIKEQLQGITLISH